MATVRNSYVVKTHDVIQHKDFCYIVMEHCPRGTLKEYIAHKGTSLIIKDVSPLKKL